MEEESILNEFINLVKENLKALDVSSVDEFTVDDFFSYKVSVLQNCVNSVKQFTLNTSMQDSPRVNRASVNLMTAIDLNIRRRPISEQFPELWEPLRRANESIERTNRTLEKMSDREYIQNDSISSIKGWQSNFDLHLEPVFTKIAFEYLRNQNQDNDYVNVFDTNEITKKWPPPNVFELDGLIYDQSDNILYMVESKFHLREGELTKACETRRKFELFLESNFLDVGDRKDAFNRRWSHFFNKEYGLIKVEARPSVKAFLGYHSSESKNVLDKARREKFQLIGPRLGTANYEVYL